LQKDFRNFRRDIDKINLDLATLFMKNDILEDPKDLKIIESEVKRSWNKDFLMKQKSKKIK
jgi:hypothetical protein